MAKFTLLLCTAVALHALHLWRFATPQVSGFVSIDCGSNASSDFIDPVTGIVWSSDKGFMEEGHALSLANESNHVVRTLRLFNGNRSKYCYSLSTSAAVQGAFFLVRATIAAGLNPPFRPVSGDGVFRFMLIVDADEWEEVEVGYGTAEWHIFEMYTRAKSSSIDVCFGRSTPDGDAPFVNGLELRSLPSNLTATKLMANTNANLFVIARTDYGVVTPSGVVIRNDPFDRIWVTEQVSSARLAHSTDINVTTDRVDRPPAAVLQTMTQPQTKNQQMWLNFSNLNPSLNYFAEFYFAEINPAVNASGQRVFNIFANGIMINSLGADIDVFARVGANAGYGYPGAGPSDSAGVLTFNFSSTATSVYPPFLAGLELFGGLTTVAPTASTVVSAIESIKSALGLTSYKGDPCLPVGFGYNWLNCSGSTIITAISLSNYGTGGTIPEAINTLTSLTEIHLNGNKLQGEIPDLGALASLQVLDLSNNMLSGTIPNFLATLTSLKVLKLQNNNLSGEIPAALLRLQHASKLDFNFSGNAFCASNNEHGCVPPSAPSVPSPEGSPSNIPRKRTNIGSIIGAVLGGILFVSIGIGILVYVHKRQPWETKVAGVSQSSVPHKVLPNLMIELTFQAIKDATNNFSSQLGFGGFGPVYKGKLPDGRLVAVKVASDASSQGSKEFLNEVDLLSRIHHKKLVEFLGYCSEEKMVLVYEFMSKGSLFDCLHGSSARASPLSWPARLRTMVDAAHGLEYLHDGCNPRIIHRDVKSSNILLSDKMEAKISDFGISRRTLPTESGAATTAFMGSMGYMDPDYLATMRLTDRVDVYSFGVVLLEVVCGRTALFVVDTGERVHIVEWARSLIERGAIDDLVESSLHGQYDASSVWKVLETAMACVQCPGDRRPNMSTVCLELKEAERIQQRSDGDGVGDSPSNEFSGGAKTDSLFLTNVSAR